MGIRDEMAGKAPSLLEQYRSRGVEPDNIPELLRKRVPWIVWKSFKEKPGGRFDKVPVHPKSGQMISAQDPNNHLSYKQAHSAYTSGVGDGIGIVLTGAPFTQNEQGENLYLIGLDLDNIQDDMGEAKSTSESLKSYSEVSPSGQGLRILALSTEPFGKGNAGDGREMYCRGRFLTITGHSGKGDVREATSALRDLEQRWWSQQAKVEVAENVLPFPLSFLTDREISDLMEVDNILAGDQWVECDETVAKIEELLASITPDTPYDIWRDIIWSVASLGWLAGKDILKTWSKGSDDHWDSDALDILEGLYDGYDPSRESPISIGTLFHHAERHDYGGKVEGTLTPLFAEPKAKSVKRFNILSRKDLDNLPPMEWLIEGIFPTKGLVTIFGKAGSGKTFIALDIAIAVSNGDAKWFGLRIEKRPVVYIALEGGTGIKKRVEAWEKAHGIRANDIRVVLDQFSLMSDTDADQLVEAIKVEVEPGSVVFIDTLSQATLGTDENSSVDMGKALAVAKSIQSDLDGVVVLIHHTGKDDRKGMRGHSSLHAAVDAAIEVKKTTEGKCWKTAKVKDGPDDVVRGFELQVQTVGHDKYGDPETSCAVVPTFLNPLTSEAKKPVGKNQKLVYEALEDAVDDAGAIGKDEAQTVASYALNGVISKHRAARVKEALEGLIGNGFLELSGENYIIPKPPGSASNPTP